MFRRVILKEEVQEVLELYHYSDEKGGHSGRDAMIFKISKTFPKITFDKFQLKKKNLSNIFFRTILLFTKCDRTCK